MGTHGSIRLPPWSLEAGLIGVIPFSIWETEVKRGGLSYMESGNEGIGLLPPELHLSPPLCRLSVREIKKNPIPIPLIL